MQSAGVVAQHAANYTAVGGGSFGTELQFVLRQCLVEFGQHHAGFNNYIFLIHVQLQNFIHVFRHIHHNSGPHYLTCQRSSSAARNNRRSVFVGKCNNFLNVFLVFRTGNGQRQFFVLRGIGGIKHALHVVGKNIAPELGFKRIESG